MKKVLCLMLVAMTVLALAIPMGALAERHSFSIYGVYCTSVNDPVRYYPTEIWKYNSLARMYVIHEALGIYESSTCHSFYNHWCEWNSLWAEMVYARSLRSDSK